MPKLNKSTNIAISFAPNEEECAERGIDFPQKAINKTKVKTDAGNNVKPQFSVGQIQYASWLLTDTDAELIATAIKAFTESGTYTDPLGVSSGKIIAWNNTSNMPPKKLTKSTDTIKLRESDLRMMVKECVSRIINESEYKPVTHNKTIKLDNGVEVKSLVTLSDGAGMYDIYEDDGCYVVWNRKYKGENNHWYIFPELLSALKKLPNLPLR